MTRNSQTSRSAARVVDMAHQEFNEQLHPREGTGRWATKPRTAPESALTGDTADGLPRTPSELTPSALAEQAIARRGYSEADYPENRYGESGLTAALAQGDVDADDIAAMIQDAIEADRATRHLPG
ncbi:hypothetical protein [Microbacterium xylanilyticum]